MVSKESNCSHSTKENKKVKQVIPNANTLHKFLFVSGINSKNKAPNKGVMEVNKRGLKIFILQ